MQMTVFLKQGTYQVQTAPFVKRVEKLFITFYLNARFLSVLEYGVYLHIK